ncbi:glycosyltransferase [Nitrospina gracilis]|uniref:glycosyltransferase n=1 Tax=Nitrospina gracilis TaxID=35801 RepID=UPI001F402A03|nr:glycosyltransferase [Nitrospina gracilis]MCF8719361.1 GT2 family glycosyltransferase [Nitrospina gracilis Nb-211]
MSNQESLRQKDEAGFRLGAERLPLDLQNEKVAVLVVGMHRSGTSALTRTLNLLGCDLPRTPSNDPEHWESKVIMALNDAILESGGSFWHDWERFNPGWRDSPLVDVFRARARDALLREFGDSPLFVLKDPRICRLLGFWLETVQEMKITPVVVSPIRNPLEVAASLEVRDGIPPSISKLLWLRHVLDAEAASRGHRRIFLRYDDLLVEWQTVTQRLGRRLGLSWPKSSTLTEMQIEEYLSPARRHHWKKDENILKNPGLPGWVRSTYQILIRWARDEVWKSDTGDLDEIRAAFDEASHAFSRPVAVSRRAMQKNRQYEKRNEDLENKLKARGDDVEKLRASLEEWSARIQEYEHTRSSLQACLEARNKEVEALTSHLRERDEAIREQCDRADDLENRLNARETEAEDLKSSLENQGSKLREYEDAIAELSVHLAWRRADAEKPAEILREWGQTIQEQRARADDLEHRLNTREAEAENLKSALESRNATIGEYEATTSRLNDELQARRTEMEKLAATLREHEAKVKEREAVISQLHVQLETRAKKANKLSLQLRDEQEKAQKVSAQLHDEQNKSKRISAGATRRICEISEYFFHFENWLSETLKSKRWKAGNLMGNTFFRYTPDALKPVVIGSAKFVYKWIGPALDAGPEDWEKELSQIRSRVLELMKTDDLKNEDSSATYETAGGHPFESLTDWRTHAKTGPNSPLHKALVAAETASLSRNWPEAVSQWQAVQAKFPDKPLVANIAKSNASIARRLADIDAYKKKIAEYRAQREALRSQTPAGKRIAVYTAISGNYDSVKLPETLDPRFDYYLFTDAPAPDMGIFQICPITYFHEDKTRMARYVKTHPHLFLSEYDIALWVDANIMILGDIHPLVEMFLSSGRPVAAVPHPHRKSVYEELEACIRYRKDDEDVMRKQIAHYRQAGFEHDDLAETGLLILDMKSERIRSFLETWWSQIDRFSRRDQLSLNYSLSQHDIPWHRITQHPENVRTHPLFALVGHDSCRGPAGELTQSLDAPERDPFSGHSYAEVREDRIAAEQHRRIDIVVCVHNALEDVRLCLESIERARKSEHHQLIVIDDGSASATADYLKGFVRGKSWAHLHRNEKATGYTRAANRGLELSDAELVVLLNSDTVVTDGWAEKMADAVFSTPGAGIVGPLSNAASHQSIPEHRSSKDQTAVNELPPGLTAEDMNRHCEQWTTAGILPRVPLVHGFCFGVTRAVIERVGTFDETHFPKGYGEENDYCFRAVDAGFGLVVATHTFVFHAKSKSYDGPVRVKLMKAGAENLKRLHGRARIDRAVRSMHKNTMLEALRESAKRLMEVKRL